MEDNTNLESEAIKKLKHYEFYKQNIANLENGLVDIGYRMTSPRVSACSAAPVHGGGNRYEDKLLGMIDDCESVRKRIRKAKKPIEEIDMALAVLDESERIVLDRFYIHWSRDYITELCEILHYERTKIYQIRKEAIRKFVFAMYGEEI